MLVLLDSDCLIDLFAGMPHTAEFLNSLRRDGSLLCTCSIVLTEIYSGLHAHAIAQAEQFLGQLTFLPTSEQAARRAGAWRYSYKRQGISLSTTDCLIAATALEHDARLVTGNLRDFPMKDVTIIPLPRVRK